MTPNDIDDTDLDFLLDMEVLDSRIDAAFAEKKPNSKGGKRKPFSYPKRTIDQIMNF